MGAHKHVHVSKHGHKQACPREKVKEEGVFVLLSTSFETLNENVSGCN